MQRLQAVDKAVGLVACAALQPLRWLRALRRRRSPVERVLLIKFWGLGSLQLLTPAARALRERLPGARLTLLTLKQNGAFARGLGAFDEVLELDVGCSRWGSMARRIQALVGELRRRDFDVVYDFEFFTRFSALITVLTGAPESHGFAAPTVWRGHYHTHTAPFNRYWHVARNFRCLAGGENGRDVRPEDLRVFGVRSEHRIELDAALEAASLAADGPLAVLNPNAGSLSLERRWPQTAFAELARTLVEEDGARVVLVGAPNEVDWTGGVAARLADLPPGRWANLAGKLSIGGLQALVESASVFVSNDSGPMHLAAAQGVPTVGLFGPETPVMYRPIGLRATALYNPPACSPCINVHDNKVANCVRGRPECLTNLSVPMVLAETRARLRRDALVPRGAPPAAPSNGTSAPAPPERSGAREA